MFVKWLYCYVLPPSANYAQGLFNCFSGGADTALGCNNCTRVWHVRVCANCALGLTDKVCANSALGCTEGSMPVTGSIVYGCVILNACITKIQSLRGMKNAYRGMRWTCKYHSRFVWALYRRF